MINIGDHELCLPYGNYESVDKRKYEFFDIYCHGWKHLANLTLDWYPMDTQELFKHNVKNNPENKGLLKYIDNPITYKLNEYSFRADSFDTKEPGNVFLGCSHTFGVGNHLDHLWAYNLNKLVGGKFFNLGTPGHGISTSLRLLRYWSTKLNIKNIFHYQPRYHRYEFYKEDKNNPPATNIEHITGYQNLEKIKDYNLRDALSSDQNLLELYKNSLLAISGIAQALGINYYYYMPIGEGYDNEEPLNTRINPARDLAHFPLSINNKILESFKSKLI